MNLNFRTAFQVSLLHNFYKDSLCNDFSLFPVAETKELLRNRQAIFSFKNTFGKVMLQEDKTETTAAHPIESKDAFVFAMTLLNPSLGNITIEWPSPKKIFLFTNEGNLTDPAGAPVELIRSEITLCGKTLVHRIVSNDAVTLSLTDEHGAQIDSVAFPAGSADREKGFSLQKFSGGLFTVTETVGMNTTAYVYYADNELLFKNVFGLVRIINQPAFPFSYDGKPVYQVSFTSKSSAWKYYVVAPNLSGADISTQLNITDTGRTGLDVIEFDKTYPVPPADTTAPMLYSDTTKIALFTSTIELQFMQLPRKQIELRKGSTVLLADLPNPDVKKPTTEILIYV